MLAVPLRAIVIAVGIHILWGGIAVAVKFSLEVFPPLWTAFFRFAIGLVCIGAWARFNGVRIWPRPAEWLALTVLSALFTLQIATMNIGIQHSTGAIASILMSTNPLFAAFFTHLLLADDKLTWPKAFGLGVAFAGTVIVLLQTADLGRLQIFNLGNWVLLFSAALLGGRLAFSARLLRQMDAVRVLVWQLLFSLPLFALGGYWFEDILWQNWGWKPLAGILYQGVIIAGLGFMVTYYLMQKYTPSVMLSFNFVAPIAGVLLSAWLLAEPLTWQLWLGLATVGLGLLLIARGRAVG